MAYKHRARVWNQEAIHREKWYSFCKVDSGCLRDALHYVKLRVVVAGSYSLTLMCWEGKVSANKVKSGI